MLGQVEWRRTARPHAPAASRLRRLCSVVAAVPVAIVLIAHPADAATLNGTKGHDTVIGTNEADDINLYAGNDRAEGLDGEDVINGYAGADTIIGGDGEDVLIGRSGPDTIYLNSETTSPDPLGDDRDSAYGHMNDDVIYAQDSTSPGDADYVNCGGGNDTAFVDATTR